MDTRFGWPARLLALPNDPMHYRSVSSAELGHRSRSKIPWALAALAIVGLVPTMALTVSNGSLDEDPLFIPVAVMMIVGCSVTGAPPRVTAADERDRVAGCSRSVCCSCSEPTCDIGLASPGSRARWLAHDRYQRNRGTAKSCNGMQRLRASSGSRALDQGDASAGASLIGITFSNLVGDDAVQLVLPFDGAPASAIDATLDSLRRVSDRPQLREACSSDVTRGFGSRCFPTEGSPRTRRSCRRACLEDGRPRHDLADAAGPPPRLVVTQHEAVPIGARVRFCGDAKTIEAHIGALCSALPMAEVTPFQRSTVIEGLSTRGR